MKSMGRQFAVVDAQRLLDDRVRVPVGAALVVLPWLLGVGAFAWWLFTLSRGA